jgi:Acetyltransferase (GNAT) domain
VITRLSLFFFTTESPIQGQIGCFFNMKTAYTQFCAQRYTPLYWQPWWLDATCGPDGWQVRLAGDKGGEPIAAWVAHERRKWGILPVWSNPPLTTYSGCWYHPPDNPDFKSVTRYAWEKQMLNELIRQFPRRTLIRQALHPDILYTLPLHWAGFGLQPRFSYTFDSVPALADWLPLIKRKLRTDLLKAQRLVQVESTNDPALVFELHQMSMSRKQVSTSYNGGMFNRLIQTLQQHQQVQMWLARDVINHAPHAALCLVWDERSGYLLLSGTHPSYKFSGGVLLLMQTALQFCHEKGIALDFEGSMQEPIEMVLRSFGGRLTPYQAVRRW